MAQNVRSGVGAGQGAASPDGRAIWDAGTAGLRRATAVALGFSAAVNLLMLTGSIYMLQVYDRVLTSGSLQTLLALFVIVVVLHVFLALYDFLRVRLMSRAAVRLDRALAPAAFRAWLVAGVPGHAAAGEASDSRPLSDLATLRGFLSGPAVTGVMDVPFVPLFLAVLFVIHPWLGFLTVAGAVLVGVIAAINRILTRTPFLRAGDAEVAARSFADHGRRSAETLLAMGMMRAVTQRWNSAQTAALAEGQRGSDPSEALAAASKAFRLLLQSAILTLGAYLVLRQEISAGMIIAASVLSGRALAPVDQVIGQWRMIGKAVEARRALRAFFDALPADPPRIALPAPTGRIELLAVTKYAPGQPRGPASRILSSVSFSLQPGDGLGVIGNSAAGKSTLARIVTGAWTPDAGEVRFDGATPDQWSPEDLGRVIGYLPQAVDLIPGSVRDIIARFEPQPDDAAVIEAAETAGVHEMILSLPDGYATRVGRAEGLAAGLVPLSGGQIQRLGLARALYRWPRIVVLDEPNANLDVAGDEALASAVAQLRARGSTVIVMAHRPSALAAVNKLMILHHGQVARFGDKADVLGVPAGGGRPGPRQTPADLVEAGTSPDSPRASRAENGAKPEAGPALPQPDDARPPEAVAGTPALRVAALPPAQPATRPGLEAAVMPASSGRPAPLVLKGKTDPDGPAPRRATADLSPDQRRAVAAVPPQGRGRTQIRLFRRVRDVGA
ncbi:MAG: type I secretion system permease/ATPase [Gemmobacter sp.]